MLQLQLQSLQRPQSLSNLSLLPSQYLRQHPQPHLQLLRQSTQTLLQQVQLQWQLLQPLLSLSLVLPL